ncbi:hypothetical protein BurJ1DRAFT_1191 [Burkholderiales bacterium JOSHI_001]|nr:hypothetical protein BurJ1DRAFT_1191 [Burkholderiales bacterium JOSHI_001]
MDMLLGLAQALHDTPLSQALRASLWLYPLVNTGHLLGMALLFGAIVVLDLRLNGLWRPVPAAPLAQVLVPVAACGLALALATGALLFSTRPTDYLHEPLFGAKLALLAVAGLNIALLHRARGWPGRSGEWPADPLPLPWRLAGRVSALCWLGVIVLGRLIGYR